MSVAQSACSFEIGTQNRIQLLPASDFRTVDGRPANLPAWKINKSIAAKIIDKASLIKNPFVVDYDHASIDAKTNGIQAPAAGFFKGLHWIDGVGLFAFVEWTAKAAAFIRAGEYKFISPALQFNQSTGEIISIINAGITNSPAIDAMMPVTALSRLTDIEKTVCCSLGISEAEFLTSKKIEITPQSNTTGDPLKKSKHESLSVEEQAVCYSLGLTESQFMATKAKHHGSVGN